MDFFPVEFCIISLMVASGEEPLDGAPWRSIASTSTWSLASELLSSRRSTSFLSAKSKPNRESTSSFTMDLLSSLLSSMSYSSKLSCFTPKSMSTFSVVERLSSTTLLELSFRSVSSVATSLTLDSLDRANPWMSLSSSRTLSLMTFFFISGKVALSVHLFTKLSCVKHLDWVPFKDTAWLLTASSEHLPAVEPSDEWLQFCVDSESLEDAVWLLTASSERWPTDDTKSDECLPNRPFLLWSITPRPTLLLTLLLELDPSKMLVVDCITSLHLWNANACEVNLFASSST